MNDYQTEQIKSLNIIDKHLKNCIQAEKQNLVLMISDYLKFRDKTSAFLSTYFGDICTKNCYESQISACCSKDGIITFWGDMVINVLVSEAKDIETLYSVLRKSNKSFKCVYLGDNGCIWKIKPLVCEMFLCDSAKKEIFEKNPFCEKTWIDLNHQKKKYTWPNQPVLFDALEQYFIDAGYNSSLMYLHNSPGLMRVKQKAIEKGIYNNER